MVISLTSAQSRGGSRVSQIGHCPPRPTPEPSVLVAEVVSTVSSGMGRGLAQRHNAGLCHRSPNVLMLVGPLNILIAGHVWVRDSGP